MYASDCSATSTFHHLLRINCIGYVIQVFCYALSPNDGSEWRQQISAEAEHFIDVSAIASDAIGRLINDTQIQILVNLNGYTKVSALWIVGGGSVEVLVFIYVAIYIYSCRAPYSPYFMLMSCREPGMRFLQ